MVESVLAQVAARGAAWIRHLLLAGVALWAVSAAATTVIPKDFRALCAEADLVFVGTVSAVRSQWAEPDRHAIETLVTFSVLTWMRGGDTPAVTLRFGGGQVGDIRAEVVGMPHFAAGDHLVILARQEHSMSPIVGFSQGYFRVVEGPAGPVVLNAGGQPVIQAGDGALVFGAVEAGPAVALPLPAFLDALRRELAYRPSAPP